MWKSTVVSMPRVGLWIWSRKCTVGCWLAVAPEEWWCKKGESCVILWGEQFGEWWAVQSDLSPQECYGVNPHKRCVQPYTQEQEGWEHNWEQSHRFIKDLLHLTSLTGFSDEMSSTGWEERNEGVLARGKANLVGLQEQGQHKPLCARDQSCCCCCCTRGMALETLQSRETTQGNKKPFQVTHGAHLCSSESTKSTRISWVFEYCKAVYWGVVLLDALRVYSTIETVQHAEICCFLLFSWGLIAAARKEELVKGYVVWVCPLLHPVYSARTTDMIKLTHILRCFGGMCCRVQHFAEYWFLNQKKWFSFQPSSLHTEVNALLCILSQRVSFHSLELDSPTLSCTE